MVLSAVQKALSQYGTTDVTLVGHSLGEHLQLSEYWSADNAYVYSGAAISLLDAVFLPLHISNATFRTVLYGLPRVHNFSELTARGNYLQSSLILATCRSGIKLSRTMLMPTSHH